MSYHIKIVPSNATYGHSLGSQNFVIRENIEAFPVGSYEMNLCVPLFLNLKSLFSVFPAPSLIIRF